MTELAGQTKSQRLIASLKQKQILVLGIGLSGLSCARFLQSRGIAFSVNDSRKNPPQRAQFEQEFNQQEAITSLVFGHWDHQLIASADVLLVSPGLDLNAAGISGAINSDCQVWGDVELYCRLQDTPTLAVTGSNGKSTVVSLLAHLGQACGINSQLAGNIGVPVLDLVDLDIDCLVLELSSFQLETLSSMHALAASVLNLSEDHLDRHHTMQNYQGIKQGIYRQCQTAVVNRDDDGSAITSPSPDQRIVSFGSDKPDIGQFGLALHQGESHLMYGEQALIAVSDLPLAGVHNALNYLAALALGVVAGWPLVTMVTHLTQFKGLAHRCQRIDSTDSICWINDSKGTNVGATLAMIQGLAATMTDKQQLFLIAGGDGKGQDFTPLALSLKQQVQHVFGIGQDSKKIMALCQNSSAVTSLQQAVLEAMKMAKPDDIVLLSPACSSLDMFDNFAQRGDVFIAAVKRLTGKAELCH
jgi:UDP-N-acetylmuramoylalanine--D-glutamate ligase